jgi:Domain of unknown function (DUF4160)
LGKVDCIAIEGLRFWFNSNDHLPPHFHVTKTGEWEIRVYFLRCVDSHLDFDRNWGDGPSRNLMKQLLALVLKRRPALLEEWELKVCR